MKVERGKCDQTFNFVTALSRNYRSDASSFGVCSRIDHKWRRNIVTNSIINMFVRLLMIKISQRNLTIVVKLRFVGYSSVFTLQMG